MNVTRRVASSVLAAVALSVAVGVETADAHRPQFKSSLVRLDGPFPDGFVTMRPTNDGGIMLNLPHHPPGGSLVIDFRLNAVQRQPQVYPINADLSVFPLGFETFDQDKLEVHDLRVLDGAGTIVALLGNGGRARAGKLLAAPLVWVVDTPSDVGFTRGGDTVLSKKGAWTVGFDALRSRATGKPLNNTGNRAEIEVSIDGGPWQVFTVSFDVRSGKSRPNGRPGVNIGTVPTDRVFIRRVDVFDAEGHMFATMGIRMGKQGHYRESSPPPLITPTPTPVAALTPTPSPEPTLAPSPEPSPEPTPEPTPEVTPTPDTTPTPDPTPTQDSTPTP